MTFHAWVVREYASIARAGSLQSPAWVAFVVSDGKATLKPAAKLIRIARLAPAPTEAKVETLPCHAAKRQCQSQSLVVMVVGATWSRVVTSTPAECEPEG